MSTSKSQCLKVGPAPALLIVVLLCFGSHISTREAFVFDNELYINAPFAIFLLGGTRWDQTTSSQLNICTQ